MRKQIPPDFENIVETEIKISMFMLGLEIVLAAVLYYVAIDILFLLMILLCGRKIWQIAILRSSLTYANDIRTYNGLIDMMHKKNEHLEDSLEKWWNKGIPKNGTNGEKK